MYVPIFAKNRQHLVQTVRAQAVDRDQKRKNAVGGPAQWDDWVTAPCMWYMWYPRINMQKHVGKTHGFVRKKDLQR